jgi:hypothetical protein
MAEQLGKQGANAGGVVPRQDGAVLPADSGGASGTSAFLAGVVLGLMVGVAVVLGMYAL